MARADKDIETVKIPFLGNPTNRDTVTSKDQRFVNAYFDVIEGFNNAKTYNLVKRPGYSQHSRPPGANATGRGVHSWNGAVYSCYADKLYKNTTDLGVTLTTTSGLCGITTTRPGAGTPYIGFNDGIKLYIVNGTTDAVTTVTLNFPTPNVRDLIYMDGYWFTMKTTGTIYQCNLDDPTTWDASKIITAQMFNGTGIGMARQQNLVLAFSDTSIQAFYDAANASGSVLTNIEQASHQLGAVSMDSITHDEEEITWVSASGTGGYAVMAMDGISGMKQLSTPGIERLLRGEGSSISSCSANLIRIAGHKFYLLNLASQDRTLVWDYNTELWLEWQAAGGSGKFPLVDFTEHNGTLLGQHGTNGRIYTLSEGVYQDDSSNFTVLGRFKRVDLDDTVRKFVRSAELIGDVQSSTTNVSLQYSDDDWGSLSTARTLDLSRVRPFAMNLGNFRRRSWQISYSGANPLRLEALQLKLRLGTE